MIRRYDQNDMQDVSNVWCEVAKTAYKCLNNNDIEEIRCDLEQKYMPNAKAWVAEYDGDIIGFISLLDDTVGGLFVLPEYQNMGVGKSLIEHAKKRNGKVSLEVLKESTKLLHFYERCGFSATKESICPITGAETITVQLH